MSKKGTGFSLKDFPRGRHLTTFICCCLMAAVSMGMCANAWGIYLVPASKVFGVGQGAIAMHVTLGSIACGLCGPLVIKLSKTIKIKTLCLIGAVVVPLTTLLMGYVPNVFLLNVLGFIRGAATATIQLTMLTVIMGNWFRKSRSTITGLAFCFSGVAGAVFSPIFSSFNVHFGFRGALTVTALIMFLLLFPMNFFFLEGTPEECGLEIYGAGEDLSGASPAASMTKRLPYTPKSVTFLMLLIVSFLCTCVSCITSHINGYAQSNGYDPSFGAMLLSVIMIGNIVFKLILGVLSDHIGSFKASFCSMAVNALGLALFLLFPGVKTLLFMAAVCFGTIYSVVSVGFPGMVRTVYGSANYGAAYALMATFTSFGGALATSGYGLLYDVTGTFATSILIALIASATACVLALVVERIYKAKAVD